MTLGFFVLPVMVHPLSELVDPTYPRTRFVVLLCTTYATKLAILELKNEWIHSEDVSCFESTFSRSTNMIYALNLIHH